MADKTMISFKRNKIIDHEISFFAFSFIWSAQYCRMKSINHCIWEGAGSIWFCFVSFCEITSVDICSQVRKIPQMVLLQMWSLQIGLPSQLFSRKRKAGQPTWCLGECQKNPLVRDVLPVHDTTLTVFLIVMQCWQLSNSKRVCN